MFDRVAKTAESETADKGRLLYLKILLKKHVLLISLHHKDMLYSWPLNKMSLNRTSPLLRGFFSIANIRVLHDPQLVESMDAEPWIRKAHYKLYLDFDCVEGQHPNPCIVQGSTV